MNRYCIKYCTQARSNTYHLLQVPASPLPKQNSVDESEITNLDIGSRSSPQPRQRTFNETTPTLHHIHSVDEDGEIVINKSPTIKGRRSPDDRFRRTQTVSPLLVAPETYDVPPKRLTKQQSADCVLSDSHYHIPKPSSSSEYGVPRPFNDPRNAPDYYHQPTPANQTFKVPIPYTRNGMDTYDSPKHAASEQLYNSPKPVKRTNNSKIEAEQFYGNVSNGTTGQLKPEDFYNVPKSESPRQSPPNIYNTPTRRGGSHKLTDTDFTDGGTSSPRLHKLRSAKSAESLFSKRVNSAGTIRRVSPPEISPEHNMYVDIEQNRQVSIADNLYAEIPANYVPRQAQISVNGNENSSVPQPSLSLSQFDSSTTNSYNQLPSRMGSQIQKQRDLVRDGYELCLPAEMNSNPLHSTMTLPHQNKHSSVSPPPLRNHRGTSLEKYDIHLPNVRSSRPRSEADLLEGTEFSNRTSGSVNDVLGSSIPNESSFSLADEYVIVTHRDTSIKFPPTEPQGIPISNVESSNQNEEYQVMSAVKINRSQLLYDTPNPSPSSGDGGQSYDSKMEPIAAEYGNVSHDVVQDSHYDTINPANYPGKNYRSSSSFDMDGISPRSSRHLESSKTLSMGSLSSVFSEPEVGGQVDHVTTAGMAVPNMARMRIASGSPRDVTTSSELK